MALSKKYLERLTQRFSREPSIGKAPKTVSAEQMEQFEQAIRQQRIECEKGGWRADAKWLEKNFPQDFGEAKAAPRAELSYETRSSIHCSNSEPVNETPTVEPQPLANVPESPQTACEALPAAPSPIPLASEFWQSLLFGSPDSLVPSPDATRALQLVSDKLGVPIAEGETIGTMRAGQLRKLLRDRFGPADAEQTTAALWRSAP